MQYTSHYCSPIGDILLAADDIGLTGLWFEGQKYFALYPDKAHEEKGVALFEKVKQWLDIYFSGKEPDFTVPLHFIGTDFQNEVWEILCTIPYGQTITYGEIAKLAALRMSGLVTPAIRKIPVAAQEAPTGERTRPGVRATGIFLMAGGPFSLRPFFSGL